MNCDVFFPHILRIKTNRWAFVSTMTIVSVVLNNDRFDFEYQDGMTNADVYAAIAKELNVDPTWFTLVDEGKIVPRNTASAHAIPSVAALRLAVNADQRDNFKIVKANALEVVSNRQLRRALDWSAWSAAPPPPPVSEPPPRRLEYVLPFRVVVFDDALHSIFPVESVMSTAATGKEMYDTVRRAFGDDRSNLDIYLIRDASDNVIDNDATPLGRIRTLPYLVFVMDNTPPPARTGGRKSKASPQLLGGSKRRSVGRRRQTPASRRRSTSRRPK